MRCMSNPTDRNELVTRLQALTPDRHRQWGTMSAAQMIAHLADQMRHTLGDATAKPIPGCLRWGPLRKLVIYWLPWPKGRVQGPPEAFVTTPTDWDADIAALVALVDRFAASDLTGPWPDHALFGPMTGRDWDVMCYKHFDHHLRQFGV